MSTPKRRFKSATPSCNARVTASSHVSTDGVVLLSHHDESFELSVLMRKRVTNEKRPWYASVTSGPRSSATSVGASCRNQAWKIAVAALSAVASKLQLRTASTARRSTSSAGRACARSGGASAFACSDSVSAWIAAKSSGENVGFFCSRSTLRRARYGSYQSNPRTYGYDGGAGRWLAVTMKCSGGS